MGEYFTHNDLTSDYFQTLINKSRPSRCKLVWVLVTLACLGFTFFVAMRLLTEYFKYKSYNEVSDKWLIEVDLPAMTICNLNLVNYTSMIEDTDGGPEEIFDDFVKELTAAVKGGGEFTEERLDVYEKMFRDLNMPTYFLILIDQPTFSGTIQILSLASFWEMG